MIKIITKKIIVYLLFSMPFFLQAQQKLDTIFYNQNWEVTKVKDSIEYYRIATKVKNEFQVNDYYTNNQLQMSGTFISLDKENRNGNFKFYTKLGELSSEGIYKNNLKQGVWKEYKNGKLWVSSMYEEDSLNGEFLVFYPTGKIKRNDIYRKGELKVGLCYDKNGNDTTYFPFEEYAQFEGGEEEMEKFISETIEYPDKALNEKLSGRVIVRYYVDVKGRVKEPLIMSNTPEILNKSALKCIKLMPDFTPASIDGVKIGTYFYLPIVFNLSQ